MSALSPYLNFRTLALALLYTLVLSVSYFVAYELRFDFNVPEDFALDRTETIWWVVALQVLLLFACRQFDSILAYFRLPDALRLFTGLFASALVLASMWFVCGGQGVPPRAVILSDFLVCFLSLAGFRIFMRVKASNGLADWLAVDDAENVLIVGAGEVGAGLD